MDSMQGKDSEVTLRKNVPTKSKSEPSQNEEDTYEPDVQQTAENIQAWREILVNLDQILNWERPHLLFAIQAAIAIGFLLIWLLGPSLLTSMALLGLICTALDFAVPIVAPRLFEKSSWTQYEQDHFLAICKKLTYVYNNVTETIVWLWELRISRPTLYFTLMSVFFVIMAFVGEKFNNLLLSFLFINIAIIVPGLIKHGVVHRLYGQIKKVIEYQMGKRNPKRGQ